MPNFDHATKLKLESLFDMRGGYVLDFSDDAFADFVKTSAGFDPYEKYPGSLSKAKRLRQLWQEESSAVIDKLNLDLLDHWVVSKRLAGETPSPTDEALHQELVDHFTRARATTAAATLTTEATVTANKIEIEIHEDIYDHIQQLLATEDYFHAVDESYKVVREKLRELTSSEKATDVFNQSAQSDKHYEALFGKAKADDASEADFFRGVGYLHLGVQFLRNEKAHTLATSMEPNLALHYISLASLAYDLITKYVSEETIQEIEDMVIAKWRGYRSASAFHRDFKNGRWLQGLQRPASMDSATVRNALKDKWLDEADFTQSWDHSNFVLMRLQLVIDDLTKPDLDRLLDLPTVGRNGHDQLAGMATFLTYMETKRPDALSEKAKEWMTANGE